MFHFIVNPNAGRNDKAKYKQLIRLIKSNKEHAIWETTEPLEAVSFAKKAVAEGATRIIAVGGDGTINEVASVLVGSDIPLGIIPFGSGNGLARHLHLPLDFTKAYQKAIEGTVQNIDTCSFNGRAFFCTAGIGFDASVAHQFAAGSGRGLVNYIKATIATLFRYQPITISINDGPEEQVYSLTIANANQFGNNAFISPFSNIQDGVFEITKIKKINLWEAAIIGIRLFNKTIHKVSKVNIYSEKNIKINYGKNHPMHLDGENIFSDASDLVFTIKPNSLKVIV